MYKFEKKIKLPEGDLDIVALGELLIDMISESYDKEEIGSTRYTQFFGGSPGNLSINLSKLGFKSALIANVGMDDQGRFLINKLKDNKVNIKGITVDEDNSTSLVLVTKSKDNPRFTAYREADKNIQFTEERLKLLNESKILHFTSWPISYDPARETTLNFVDKAKKKGLLIGFDPNYRKVLWEKGQDGIKFIEEILSKTDIVKPSLDDAYHLFGEGSPEDYINKFLELGVKIVILTLGKDGLIASNGKETIKLPTRAKKVIDTTGAGDAFWSGLYGGILKGRSIKDAIDIGSAVSAFKLQTIGGLSELPAIEEIIKSHDI